MQFIDSIVSFIDGLVPFVVDSFKTLTTLVKSFTISFNSFNNWFTLGIPASLVVIFSFCLIVSVICRILGR